MTNKDSVLAMYQTVYKNIYRLFEEVMPLLSRRFDYGHLRRTFNRSGARNLMISPLYPDPEFWNFRKLMFSSGALGVVDSETGIYVNGTFQFNQLHPLTVHEKSELCVHPIFSRVYELKEHSNNLVVLPRGSDYRIEEGQARQ